jgi:hypothetical protein
VLLYQDKLVSCSSDRTVKIWQAGEEGEAAVVLAVVMLVLAAAAAAAAVPGQAGQLLL